MKNTSNEGRRAVGVYQNDLNAKTQRRKGAKQSAAKVLKARNSIALGNDSSLDGQALKGRNTRQTNLTPSRPLPPSPCQGEGRGEDADFSTVNNIITPLPNPLPACSSLGEGTRGTGARQFLDASAPGRNITAKNVKTPSSSHLRSSATSAVTPPDSAACIRFRSYQEPVFLDRTSGILVLHWSRQIGKSFTLASWAVDRLLSQLQHYDSWLITVLSNSRDNGAEFNIKCSEVCARLGLIFASEDQSTDITYANMRMETHVKLGEKTGRIKVLAANPRTARGFSGDLILDEFAFHEDSAAIWEAAEPILSSNPEFLCRIASTGNGKHNMFYRMAGTDGPRDGTIFANAAGFRCSKVSRSEAYLQGVKVYDPTTRRAITPAEARAQSLDKRAYDQNYELSFADESMALLTHELISAAERAPITIDEQEWSAATLARLVQTEGELFVGQDFGRNRDLSVVVVGEKIGALRRVLGLLRLASMRSPAQQRQVDLICALPKFRRLEMDMTGNGLGLCEYLQEKWGTDKIHGINFASTEPVNDPLRAQGRKAPTARVTEIMATALVATFEDRSLEIPADTQLRDDLRKPEKVVSPGGRVSIAATRNEAGHADHFWALALFVRASQSNSGPFVYERIERRHSSINL